MNTPLFISAELDDFGLTPNQFRVLAHVSRRGDCWESSRNIANICRLHLRTVRKSLKELTTMRLLNKEERKGQTTKYKLAAPTLWIPPCQTERPLPNEGGTPLPCDGSPPLPNGYPQRVSRQGNTKRKKGKGIACGSISSAPPASASRAGGGGQEGDKDMAAQLLAYSEGKR